MNREEFLARVHELRYHGKSIRAIATELGVHRSRVERGLRAVARTTPDEMAPRLALSTPSQSNTFVGRRQEMGDLKAALQDAMSGRGRLIMLAGEPGIGKTRTAQEIANQAQAQGAVPFWGRCYEEEGTPAYWPWIQIIRSLSGQLEDGPLKEAMGPRAADISKIVPELMQRLPGLEPPPQLEPEQARFRLFDSITAFFKRAAAWQPLVLVLEDLHWADQASLLLLHHLARDLDDANLLTMGTYRDVEVTRQHPLTETLGQLSRERGFQKIVLKGLGEEDAEGFCRAASGVTPSPSLVAAIHAHTEGNPFFMTEIVRLLGDRGELAGDG